MYNDFASLNLDQLDSLPARQGVFLIETGGEPYINKSADLRKRVGRLLAAPAGATKRLSLHDTARSVWYRETGSQFESSVLLWQLNREHFPDSYRRRLRLRAPMHVKLLWDNEYPRCCLTRRLGRRGLYFGPFRSRLAADRFQQAFLDLFLIRRCVETIRPDPAHPGCIYGEMKMCLRPCQAATTHDAYMEETARVRDFLATRGEAMVADLEAERASAADSLAFERAAEVHKRLEKVKAALDVAEIVGDIERLYGVVIQASATAGAVELFPVYRGYLLPRVTLPVGGEGEDAGALAARVRETLAAVALETPGHRAEQLALLARWYYRGSSKGEIVLFESWERPPLRRIVNAVGRVGKSVVE